MFDRIITVGLIETTMKPKNLISNSVLVIMLSIISACSNAKLENRFTPNILFVFADDQTYSGVNSLGNPEVITPNLDKLVESGVTFTHAYNMGAWGGAVCVASRAMLNTGRMIFSAKKANDSAYNDFTAKGLFWSQMMETKGYDTYISGKWHVNVKPENIFKNVGTIRAGMPGTVPESYNRPSSALDTIWKPWHSKYGGYWAGGVHWSESLADEAIEFLDQSAERDNPFFMYLAFNAPHDPRQSPKEYVDLYPLEGLSLPTSFQELYPYKDEMGCPPGLRDEKLAPFPRTALSVKTHIQEYYAIISHMDAQIGRIIDYLKETGQDKNTYILFSADHGLACGKHGLLGKQNMYDHSMRVPLVVVGPDIPKNEKRNMQVYLQDLMATSLDLAGVEKPEYIDFNSLLPLIEDSKRSSAYPEIYGAYMNLQRMIRSESHKLIYYPEAKVYRLYDMLNDPDELNDLAGEKEMQKIIQDLSDRFSKQQKILGDTLNMKSFFPELF